MASISEVTAKIEELEKRLDVVEVSFVDCFHSLGNGKITGRLWRALFRKGKRRSTCLICLFYCFSSVLKTRRWRLWFRNMNIALTTLLVLWRRKRRKWKRLTDCSTALITLSDRSTRPRVERRRFFRVVLTCAAAVSLRPESPLLKRQILSGVLTWLLVALCRWVLDFLFLLAGAEASQGKQTDLWGDRLWRIRPGASHRLWLVSPLSARGLGGQARDHFRQSEGSAFARVSQPRHGSVCLQCGPFSHRSTRRYGRNM